MKKIKFLSWLLILCVLVTALSPAAYAIDEPPALTSAAIYLADAQTGYVYYERNSSNKVYPASLTKIMTALLVVEAIERGDLTIDQMVTAQPGFDFDMDKEGSSAQIVEGETMPLEDLLYCILLVSANEACNIAAVTTYGTIPAFVAKMNERAQQLGCTGTHFANPHGLPNPDHYTTAYDMYLITQEALKHELFAKICDTIEYTVDATNKSDVRGLTNTNGLITSASVYKGYYYEPAIGVKTGYTKDAGYCLISSALRNDINPICVVMGGAMTESANGSLDHSNYSDSIKLYNWVFSNYTRMELVEGDSIVKEVPVKLGSDADLIALRAAEPVTGVLPNDADLSQLQTNIKIYTEEKDGLTVRAPFNEGEVLGEVSVVLNGVNYGTTYLVANRSIALSYISALLDNLLSTLSNPIIRAILLLALVALGAYGTIAIRYRLRFRKQQAEVEEAKLQRQKLQEQAERDRMMSDARRRSYHSKTPGRTPPPEETTRDYFEEFFDD